MEPKRLNKFISDAGFCSRREADQLIAHERVTVNSKLPEPGMKVSAKDKVRIDGQLLQVRDEAPVFLVFNKPPGIATTTDRSARNNIISSLNYPASIQPIGFLDRESEGLIFLSNDTELVQRMTKADNQYEKEYVVTVDKMMAPDFLVKISESPAATPGGPRKKSAVTREGLNRFRIVLEPGMYHNIKKRCEELGYKVLHLQRVRVANVTTAKLPVGMWRVMTEAEVAELKQVIAGRSRKAQGASSRDEDGYFEEGLPARRSAPKPRSNAGRPLAPARSAGTKPQGGRKAGGLAASGPGAKGKAPASRGSAAKGRTGGSAAAGRNSAPKGRRRG